MVRMYCETLLFMMSSMNGVASAIGVDVHSSFMESRYSSRSSIASNSRLDAASSFCIDRSFPCNQTSWYF